MPEFSEPLREQDVDPCPFVQFSRWFEQAADAGLRAPEAATLATATLAGVPSARMVLVRLLDRSSFVFYSNYESRKGRELAANPNAAVVFHWEPVGRQVRIEGLVERTSSSESAAYVHSRPRASQISALASPQSEIVASREFLERQASEIAREYQSAELPVPEGWGGFRLMPGTFEFWQHREDRLHDRLRYSNDGEGTWRLERLAP
jgi:pyridoxamine 5'-phosphate oxidase